MSPRRVPRRQWSEDPGRSRLRPVDEGVDRAEVQVTLVEEGGDVLGARATECLDEAFVGDNVEGDDATGE